VLSGSSSGGIGVLLPALLIGTLVVALGSLGIRRFRGPGTGH
jgi:hypothetical protein